VKSYTLATFGAGIFGKEIRPESKIAQPSPLPYRLKVSILGAAHVAPAIVPRSRRYVLSQQVILS
jgi:hypothetical protein